MGGGLCFGQKRSRVNVVFKVIIYGVCGFFVIENLTTTLTLKRRKSDYLVPRKGIKLWRFISWVRTCPKRILWGIYCMYRIVFLCSMAVLLIKDPRQFEEMNFRLQCYFLQILRLTTKMRGYFVEDLFDNYPAVILCDYVLESFVGKG